MVNPLNYKNKKYKDSPNAEKGYGNSVLHDPTSDWKYNSTPAEKVINGQNNTWIILGRDRPSGSLSGYGGKGDLRAGCIDIVAGRLSALDAEALSPKLEESGLGEGLKANSNIGADASRIYISQKADIDEYFKLADGYTGKSVARSAIGIKSDDIRIIARNTLKLITRTDDLVSNKESADLKVGVQLIGDNNAEFKDMQAIPKGDNLRIALMEIGDRMQEILAAITYLMDIQKDMNDALSNHTHLSGYFKVMTSPAMVNGDLTRPLPFIGKSCNLRMYKDVEQQINMIASNIEGMSLRFYIASSKEYINSKYHKLN
jgi:hypothetical protein